MKMIRDPKTLNGKTARSMLAAVPLLLAAGVGMAQEKPVINPANAVEPPALATTTFRYELETRLVYLERFSRTETGRISGAAGPAALTQTPQGGGTRTLGLSRFRAILEWEAAGNTRLRAVLRPDAPSRQMDALDPAIRREFDSRAGLEIDSTQPGPELEPKPTVRILDAYEIGLRAGESLDVALGVFEELAVTRLAYRPLLEFGLMPQFPAKFAGARLRWKNFSAPPPTGAGPGSPTGLLVDLYGFQGKEDRAEMMRHSDDTFDTAPTGEDPYQGGAATLGWVVNPTFEVDLLAGSIDSRDSLPGVPTGARKTETFGRAAVTASFPIGGRMTKLSLDFHYASNKWRGDDVDVADRTRQSTSLTSSIGLSGSLWGLLGIHMGRAEIARSGTELDAVAPIDGVQVETGIVQRLGKGLYVQVMVAQEQRQIERSGDAKGAFVNAEGEGRRTLRRMGLEVSYALEGGG